MHAHTDTAEGRTDKRVKLSAVESTRIAGLVKQSGVLSDGRVRRRQFVDYCYAPYSTESRSFAPFGTNETLRNTPGTGFAWTDAESNFGNTPIFH